MENPHSLGDSLLFSAVVCNIHLGPWLHAIVPWTDTKLCETASPLGKGLIFMSQSVSFRLFLLAIYIIFSFLFMELARGVSWHVILTEIWYVWNGTVESREGRSYGDKSSFF